MIPFLLVVVVGLSGCGT